MPALNSSTSPSQPTTSPPLKRKRTDEQTPQPVNNRIPHPERNPSHTSHQLFRDVFDVLKRYDTSPSILQQSLSRHCDEDTGYVSPNKRTRLSNGEKTESVASKIQNNQYYSLDDLVSDIDQASSEVLSSLESKETTDGATQWRYAPASPELGKLSAQLRAFKKQLDEMLKREIVHTHPPTVAQSIKAKQDNSRAEDATDPTAEARTVLTLYGNAQGHKQLFSSLQKPLSGNLWGDRPLQEVGTDVVNNAVAPVRENGLPPQIFSTKVVPTGTDGPVKIAKPPSKFRDLFAPASQLPALNPPKSLKHANTRGSTITWSQDSSSTDNVRDSDYTTHKLPTGQWLGYGGVLPAQEPSSPEAKRKMRDRALSAGEASLTTSEGAKAAEAQAKEDALFRSAYSSFAPCKDDSAAIVPEEMKNHIWWKSVGSHQFDQTFGIDPSLCGLERPHLNGPSADENEDEEKIFQEVVDQFDPNLDPLRESSTETAGTESGYGRSLNEISELLEVLHSSQRVRKSSLNVNQRPGTSQSTSQQVGSGRPTTPTASEYNNYEKAKSRLAELVGETPPAALAKLDGDELSALVVSRHIWIDGKDYKGVLEEDQTSRIARAAALSAALGPSGSSRPHATPATRANQISQPARSNASLSQYPNASSSAPRPPSNYQRQPLSSWQTPAQQMASMQRPPYTQQPNYNRPPSSSYLNNRPGSAQQSSLQNPYPQAPSQPQYQQRAQAWTGSPYQRPLGPAQPSQQGAAHLYNPNGSAAGGSSTRQPPRAPFPAQASQYIPPSAKPGSPAGSALIDNMRPHTPLAPAQQMSPAAQRPQAPSPANGGQGLASNPNINGVGPNSSIMR